MRQVDLEESVGYALKRAQTALRAAMDAELREHRLSVPQYSCLESLAQRPNLSNAELARAVFVSRQAMHQLLSGLRAAGLVAGTGEGRGERLALTDAGVRAIARASAAVAGVEERMLSSLDRSQRRRLFADLTACAEALAAPRAPANRQPNRTHPVRRPR